MTLNINGRMKVKTLKANFFKEFGLTLRIYNGRSFAEDEFTLATIRKGDSKGGEFAPQRNIKIANLEAKLFEIFGIKTQVAGSDDSYLCDDELTLKAAQLEDEKKLERKAKKNQTLRQPESGTQQQISENSHNQEAGREKSIYTTVDWFTAAESPDVSDWPENLKSAKQLWEENGGRSTPEICSLINSFIVCNFLAENMSGWDEFFASENFGEFEAEKVTVVGVEFSDESLPLIRAEAWINVQLKEDVTDDALDEWCEAEWGLVSGIMWSWNLPNEDDLDLSMEENTGAEAVWAEQTAPESGTQQQISDGDTVHINAGWEKRDDRYICRWMVVWQNIDNGTLVGAFGGYSGGGSFQMEQFYAKHSDGLLTSLMIDMEDKVTGDDIDFFDDVPPEALSLSDDAQDIIMDWHDEDEWEEAEQLILLSDKQSGLIVDKDLLLLPESTNAFVAEILQLAGVTASPT